MPTQAEQSHPEGHHECKYKPKNRAIPWPGYQGRNLDFLLHSRRRQLVRSVHASSNSAKEQHFQRVHILVSGSDPTSNTHCSKRAYVQQSESCWGHRYEAPLQEYVRRRKASRCLVLLPCCLSDHLLCFSFWRLHCFSAKDSSRTGLGNQAFPIRSCRAFAWLVNHGSVSHNSAGRSKWSLPQEVQGGTPCSSAVVGICRMQQAPKLKCCVRER